MNLGTTRRQLADGCLLMNCVGSRAQLEGGWEGGLAGWLDICHDEMIRERKKPVGLGGGRRIEKDEMGEIELS